MNRPPRTHPAARRIARSERIAQASAAYRGTLTSDGVSVSAQSAALPRNSHMRATVRALASEFSTERPIYNTRGVRIG